jgi:hypothetical protein
MPALVDPAMQTMRFGTARRRHSPLPPEAVNALAVAVPILVASRSMLEWARPLRREQRVQYSRNGTVTALSRCPLTAATDLLRGK